MKKHGLDPGAKSRVDEALDEIEANALAESPAEEVDPASYRDLTKEEVLDRIAKGYKAALDGDHRPIQELLDELDAMDD